MPRSLGCTPLFLTLLLVGCENPADNKYKATASAPKPVEGADATAPDKPAADGSAPAPSAGAFVFSNEGSKIDFIGSKVTGKHEGGFKKFNGTAELAADKPEVRKITVDIDMSSLWADDEKLAGHLKSPDFFDVAKNPKATFVTTEIKPGGENGASHTVTGNLTLHGVTKSITFPATIAVKDDSLTIASEFAINRRDFNINYPGKPNDLIRDDVVIKIDVKASKKS